MNNNIFKMLVENTQDLIFLYNFIPTPRFEYVSPSSVNINGYTPEEHYADPDLFYKLVSPDDLPFLEFIRENPKMIKKPVIMRWMHKDGRIIWTEQKYVNIFDKQGSLVAIEVIVRDITDEKKTEFALRESEKKFRELFHDINDLIFLFKLSKNKKFGKIIELNNTACRVLGYSREEFFTMSPRVFIDKKNLKEMPKIVEELILKRRIDFEIFLVDKHGGKILFDINAHFFRLDCENVILAIARDITERKKIEKELLKTQKLEAISILAGGIAHDFNNILSAMLGNISLAKLYEKKDEKLYEILKDTEKAIFRAKSLTNQLLTFSKGGSPIKKTAFLGELIKNTAIFALRGSNVKYKITLSEDLWTVNVDKDQISQVINNLVINARESMPNGGVIEIIGKNFTPQENYLPLKKCNYIQLIIKDNGVGISSENINKIFDPFFSTKKTGSGLGLASTYSIIKNHDGYITVESEEGIGTTFYIYLPADGKSQITIDKQEDDIFCKGKGKILLMDDDYDIRFVAKKLISQLGYHAEFASDGIEAIELYKKAIDSKKPFDLVIIDLTIPGGMGGKETIEKLIKINPNIKAIVSSGYHNDPVIINFEEYGFKGFITKPYTITELDAAIHNLLNN